MLRFECMKLKNWTCICLLFIGFQSSQAQVTGGQYALEFLRLPNSPHITALGGINVCNPDQDISFALQNPALMRPGLHNQLGLNYNAYYAGIHIMNLGYGYHSQKLNTSFVLGVQNIDYGKFTQTDFNSSIQGEVRANDIAISLGASRAYKDRWRYGADIKLANSILVGNSAMALLADVGVVYYDTANLLTIGATAKNMGVMLKNYNGQSEPLPFDLQIGLSKRFKHLPLRLMVTLHHLYEWDVRYNNPADITQTSLFGAADTTTKEKSYFADKLFRHFIFGGEFLLGKRIAVSIGYNHMRRGELALKEKQALSGFSFGIGLYLGKVQVHYGRSYYNVAGAYNEFGFNFALNKLLGFGKGGEKIHWNNDYGDWPNM